MPSLSKNNSRGVVLLEIVISIGVLVALVGAIATLIVTSYDVLGYSRTRITARHLANEKVEVIRNLPYDDVGVVGGVPPGDILQLEVISRNGLDYTVKTNIVYVDDPFDQLAPSDTLPIDYKRARVDVSWTGTFASDSTITLVTDVAPKGVESVGVGGTLSILVFDSLASPVQGAQVRIQNQEVNPVIDLTVETDSNGRVLLPGSPVCFECYQIDVTKENYSSDRTYSETEVAHPEKPRVTINDQSVTEISFAIDKTGSFSFTSTYGRQNNYALLGNQFFNLRGNKQIGTDTLEEPVYKYEQLLQTNGSGVLTLTGMEWDSYVLTVPASTWDLAGIVPLQPLVLLPKQNLNVFFVSEPHDDYSLLLTVIDASGSGVPQTTVRVTGPNNFDEVLETGDIADPDFGQTFFTSLTLDTYTIEATKSGFQSVNQEIDIDGNNEETVVMNQE